MKVDPAIKRTRDARRQISSNVGDDPARVVEYYLEMQKQFGARLRPAPILVSAGDTTADHQLAADAQEDARR